MVVIQTTEEELLTNNCIALDKVCFARAVIKRGLMDWAIFIDVEF